MRIALVGSPLRQLSLAQHVVLLTLNNDVTE